eukprot:11207264-Lingulodinium_polyedra.AAC.1
MPKTSKQASKQASCRAVRRHTQGTLTCTCPYAYILDAPVLQAHWQQHQRFAGLLAANPAVHRPTVRPIGSKPG